MKTIGIIGGMSPESTVLYYQIINRETNRRLGGNRSAKILLDSVDFEEIVRLQKSGDWAAAGNVLAQSARKLEAGGADFLLTAAEQDEIHRIIFDELCLNRIHPESARYFYDVIGRLKNEGAQGVILGCTEICLLVNETDSPLPVFDSTAIHALAAVDAALAE